MPVIRLRHRTEKERERERGPPILNRFLSAVCRNKQRRGKRSMREREGEDKEEKEGGWRGTDAATVDYTLFRRVKRANSRTDERYKS